jgi:hypothetical protein
MINANLILWSCAPLLFWDIICSSANLFLLPVVLFIWRYNKLKCKSCFVVLWSSPFRDKIHSSANLVLWSFGPLHLEI